MPESRAGAERSQDRAANTAAGANTSASMALSTLRARASRACAPVARLGRVKQPAKPVAAAAPAAARSGKRRQLLEWRSLLEGAVRPVPAVLVARIRARLSTNAEIGLPRG